MEAAAEEKGLIADVIFSRIKVYRLNRRSIRVLGVNKDFGGGVHRESLLVSQDDLLKINLCSDESPKCVFVSRGLNDDLRISSNTKTFSHGITLRCMVQIRI